MPSKFSDLHENALDVKVQMYINLLYWSQQKRKTKRTQITAKQHKYLSQISPQKIRSTTNK